MQATYYKDSLHSYMVIPCPPQAQTKGYQYRMLGMNRIAGLLSCSIRHIDGTGYLYYDISGRQSVAALYEDRRISGTELFRLLKAIVTVTGTLSEYLLDEQYLILSPEQIFYDMGSGEYLFTYYPGEVRKPEVFRFLADAVDGTDKRAAAAAYRLCSIAEGDRRALRDAVGEEVKEKDLPDPWEQWRRAEPPEEPGQNIARPAEKAFADGPAKGSESAGKEAKERKRPRFAASVSRKDPGDGNQKPLSGALQLLIRVALIVVLLAGAGGLIAAQILLYIPQREKRLCIAGAILLITAAVLITTEMIIHLCRERKKKREAEGSVPAYSVSDEKDLPIFGAASEEDYRMPDDEAGNTIRLSDQSTPGRLYGRERGSRVDLAKLPLTIGKAQSFSDVVLSDPSVSRVHARIYKSEEGGIEIRDLGSTNGTWINGVRIGPNEKCAVSRGDEVRFGNVEFEYR